MLKNILTTVVVMLLSITTAEAAGPRPSTQNCISNYYVVDSNGQCIGDFIGPSFLSTVARQFGNPPTLYTINILSTGFFPSVEFVYPTTDCTGQAYMFINSFAVLQTAQFDGNGVFWAPSPTIQTTITIQSTSSILPPTNTLTCHSVVPPPGVPPPGAPPQTVGAAEQVDSAFANTVVPPLLAACQIFDPDRSTSKGACKVRSDH
jgi:hypothetical protein